MGQGFGILGTIAGVMAAAYGLFEVLPPYLAAPASLFVLCIAGAGVVLYTPSWHGWLKRHLGEDTYVPLYMGMMTRAIRLARAIVGQKEEVPEDQPWRAVLRRTWTYRLQDRAILFATAYPILLALVRWAFGYDFAFAGLIVVPKEPDPMVRIITLLPLLAIPPSLVLAYRLKHQKKSSDLVGLVYLIPAALMVLPLYTIDSDIFVTKVVTVCTFVCYIPTFGIRFLTIRGSLAVLTAVFGTFGMVFAAGITTTNEIPVPGLYGGFALIAGLAAVILSVCLERLQRRPQLGGLAIWLLWVFPIGFVLFAANYAPWDVFTPWGWEAASMFIFVAVLPIINGLFDSISYFATLVFTQLGARAPRYAILFGIADGIVAFALFLGLAAALVTMLAALNWSAGYTIVNLDWLLADIRDWRSYWWLWIMAFSTAVPTLVHISIASFSLQAFLPGREFVENQMADLEELGPGLLATLALGSIWFVSMALGCFVLGAIWWALLLIGLPEFIEYYYGFLLNIADTMRAL